MKKPVLLLSAFATFALGWGVASFQKRHRWKEIEVDRLVEELVIYKNQVILGITVKDVYRLVDGVEQPASGVRFIYDGASSGYGTGPEAIHCEATLGIAFDESQPQEAEAFFKAVSNALGRSPRPEISGAAVSLQDGDADRAYRVNVVFEREFTKTEVLGDVERLRNRSREAFYFLRW